MELLHTRGRQYKKAEHIIKLLSKKNLELATMESCTGGGLAHALTSIPGAGWVYQGGSVTYSGFAKNHAGVPLDILSTTDGPYSASVAETMAKMSLRDPFQPLPQNGSVIGVGITGTLDTPDKFYPHIPPGTIWVAIYYDNKTDIHVLHIAKMRRNRMKNKIINKTLDFIAQTIEPNQNRENGRRISC